jgi:Fe-S cluster assembly protein SufD
MTALAETIAHYTQAHVQMQRVLAGSDAVKALRTEALEAFSELGFPTTAHEDWKYTSLRSVEREAFQPAAAVPDIDIGELPLLPFKDADDTVRLVFVNGRFAPSLSHDGDHPGVHIGSLAHAIDQQQDRLALLGSAADLRANGLVALNTAFLKDGAAITLEDGVTLERPVYLVFVSVAQPAGVLVQPRVFLSAGRNASACVLEHFVGLGEASNFTNAVGEYLLGDGARITHLKLQEDAPGSTHVQSINAKVARDATFESHNLQIGGRIARTDINVKLAATGAATRMNGLFFPAAGQHIDTHTRVDHLEPHTRSDEDYRGVLADNGRGVFNGKVVVHAQAQKVEAHQSSRNLLLSEKAEIDTKPELEIYADDVICSHGATVGQLDEQALFYLRSRGLDEQLAHEVLTFAFARDLIEQIDIEPLRQRVARAVLKRLGADNRLEEILT